MTRRSTALIALFIATIFAAPAIAADLKVISAGAVRGLIAEIIDDYSRQTGQKFDFTVGTTGQLRDVISSGQHADLLIVAVPLMQELEKTGKFVPGSRAELGRVGIGVAVREGASVPDVSTPDSFKQALVAAKSVAFTDPAAGGTSGIYFKALLAGLFGLCGRDPGEQHRRCRRARLHRGADVGRHGAALARQRLRAAEVTACRSALSHAPTSLMVRSAGHLARASRTMATDDALTWGHPSRREQERAPQDEGCGT